MIVFLPSILNWGSQDPFLFCSLLCGLYFFLSCLRKQCIVILCSHDCVPVKKDGDRHLQQMMYYDISQSRYEHPIAWIAQRKTAYCDFKNSDSQKIGQTVIRFLKLTLACWELNPGLEMDKLHVFNRSILVSSINQKHGIEQLHLKGYYWPTLRCKATQDCASNTSLKPQNHWTNGPFLLAKQSHLRIWPKASGGSNGAAHMIHRYRNERESEQETINNIG